MLNVNLIITSILVMAGLAALLGAGLMFAYNKLKVKEDEELKKVLETLPGLNCGACGYASCEEFGKALLEGKAPIDGCKAGGEKVAKELEAQVGKRGGGIKEAKKARLKCNAREDKKTKTVDYQGVKNCQAAGKLGSSGFGCFYGCFGFGDCEIVCPVSAIDMIDGRPEVSLKKCIGCGKCVSACPRNLFDLVSLNEGNEKLVIIGCNSHQKGAVVMKVCKSGCIACGKCVKICPVQAISLTDNLALIDPQKCTTCGKCIPVCPTKTIYEEI